MLMVDSRIGSVELVPGLRQYGVPVEEGPLDFGDIAFDGNGPSGKIMVAVERKRLRDILDCITTGRFAGYQLPGMLSRYERCYLLIEGLYKPGDTGILEEYSRHTKSWHPIYIHKDGFMYRTLDNYLTSLEVSSDRLKLRRSCSPAETVTMLVDLWHYWQKPWNQHRSTHVFHETAPSAGTGPLVLPGLVRRWAKELDGIGWDKSAAVAAKFALPGEMANATLKDWRTIPGIGPKLAAGIQTAIWGKR